jgi:hypothetical protein
VILAYILTSWLRLPYSPGLNRIQRFSTTSASRTSALPSRAAGDGGARLLADLPCIALGVIDRFLIWVLEHFH